jgi:hypothetical protein
MKNDLEKSRHLRSEEKDQVKAKKDLHREESSTISSNRKWTITATASM